jgi:hypothetical protein
MQSASNSYLEELTRVWLNISKEPNARVKQDEYYAVTFAPHFLPEFNLKELGNAPHTMPRPEYLISVLGLSWQPAALMASWCKPKHMLVLGTEESFKQVEGSSERPLDRIKRLAALDDSQLEWHYIGENDEIEMYRSVKAFLNKHNVKTGSAALDVTGGKKSMSCSAALAAFITGCPIIYVDYAKYQDRIPLPGTEFPRLLSNPLDVFGDLEMTNIREAFSRGDFSEAERRSNELSQRLYEPRKAELYGQISRAYGRWSGFRFAEAISAFDNAINNLRLYHKQYRYDWIPDLESKLADHLKLVSELECVSDTPESLSESFCIILNHLASAKRAWRDGRLSISILLLYSTLEKYLDLVLLTKYQLHDDNPDYSVISDKLNMTVFHSRGRDMYEKKYQEKEPSGPLTLGLNIQLVSSLEPALLPIKFLPSLRGLLNSRNKCEYEHGIKAQVIKPEDMSKWFELVLSILSLHYDPAGVDGRLILDERLARFEFPILPP